MVSYLGGLQYVPYERTYRGLPVVGGGFVVVTDSGGRVLTTSTSQGSTINLASITPVVSPAKAESIARGRLSTVESVSGSGLVVSALGEPTLAWRTTVAGRSAAGEPSKLIVIVDARTGDVLNTQELIVYGEGNSKWNGPNPVHLNTTQSGPVTFSLRDPDLVNVSCQNLATNTIFTGPDDLWGNGIGTDRETGCVDALFAAQTESHMLTQWLQRDGLNGAHGGWPIRVGLATQNAFYDGTQVQIGFNSAGEWISSLDVVAHELGHGIDSTTPNGISGNGTQEFIADAFGAATEWFANEPTGFDTPDYLVGERINLLCPTCGPIRNMYNPSLLGDPNCYALPLPEVHAAAGPGNHWFYLVAEGSNPTNGQPVSPTCNGSRVAGIGIQKAIQILYGAMLMKPANSSYLTYRTGTLLAAKFMFPGCAEFATVRAAWNAVGVPAQASDPTCIPVGTVVVDNPGNRTNRAGAPTDLQLTASGGTAPYVWTATGLPPGLSIAPATGLISGTPSTAGAFAVTATATDSASPSHNGSVTFTWTIRPASCLGQILANPDFEAGPVNWTATAGVIGRVGVGGSWGAWLDGYGVTHTDTVSQTVTIPPGCGAVLSFQLFVDTAETTTVTPFDRLTITAGATTVATFSNLNKNTGFTPQTFDVSALAGTTFALTWTGIENASLQTSFVIDNTALTLS